jgi:hypothetical protein
MSKTAFYLIKLTSGALVSDHYGTAILFDKYDAIEYVSKYCSDAEMVKAVKRDRRSPL